MQFSKSFSRIELIKKADSLLGRIAANLLPKPSKLQLNRDPESVLFIRPGGIGDAVHLIPSILLLKRFFPDCRIDILAEKRNVEIFQMLPFKVTVRCYDNFTQLKSQLKEKYDAVIDTEQWHRMSAAVARVIDSKIKIGFSTNERKRLFTHTVDYDHDRYERKSFIDLLKPLGIKNVEDHIRTPFIEPPKHSLTKAADLLMPLGDTPFIVFFTGASVEERKWGADRFAQVAEMLIKSGRKVVCIGGLAEMKDASKLESVGVINLTGRTTLSESAAVISKAEGLLSGDSGILHVASALGVPTVSLFGPGRWKKWAPPGRSDIMLNAGFHCSPCTTFGYTPECLNGSECMRLITVESVVCAIESLISHDLEEKTYSVI